LILGQGPIGLLFTMLLRRNGIEGLYATDRIPARLEASRRLGTQEAWDPGETDVSARMRALTEGRGADVVIVAASAPEIVEQAVDASRPGARILLFAQTSVQESFALAGASICVAERTLFGSYSASIDLQQESADIVWENGFPVEDLISHRLPLAEMEHGMRIACHPANGSLKLIVHPQR
jgi:L-iditol 2-dehydrogenase